MVLVLVAHIELPRALLVDGSLHGPLPEHSPRGGDHEKSDDLEFHLDTLAGLQPRAT